MLNILESGEKNRHYADTKLNNHSSRSHTIFSIKIRKYNQINKETTTSTLVKKFFYQNF